MFLLIHQIEDGLTKYYGPFKSEDTATAYCRSIQRKGSIDSITIAPLIVPYRVKQIWP